MASRLTKDRLFLFLVAMHVMVFVTAPLLGNKVAQVLGFRFLAGTTLFGFCYLIIDLVNNHWGKQAARRIVTDSAIVRAIFYLIFCPLAFLLPTFAAPANYVSFFVQGIRIFLAAEATLWFSQYFLEIPFFNWLRRHFPFTRSYLLTGFLSLVLNAIMFALLAGTGVPLLPMVTGQIVCGLTMRFVLAPLAVLSNRLIGRLS